MRVKHDEVYEALSPERKAIVHIGESINCCFPPPFEWGAYPAFYLTLAKEHPDIAERLLNAATEGKVPQAILDGVAEIVELLS